MSTSTIQLPTDFIANVLAQATALLGNLGGYIALIVGVLLAVLVIEILIGAIKK